jgi:hypothetical protein
MPTDEPTQDYAALIQEWAAAVLAEPYQEAPAPRAPVVTMDDLLRVYEAMPCVVLNPAEQAAVSQVSQLPGVRVIESVHVEPGTFLVYSPPPLKPVKLPPRGMF